MGNNGAGVTKRRRERDADCDNLLRTIMTPEAEDLNPQRFDIDPHTRRDQLKEFQKPFLCNLLLDSSLNTSYESYVCPPSDGVWWTNLL